MSIEPGSINREFQEAMSALQAGKLGDAERLCKTVLRAEPKHVEALNLLGVVLGRLGRNAEAIASFDKALAAAPDSVDAWYGRGMTLVAMNRPQQAVKSFDRVIAAEPGFSQAQLLRAKLLMELGRPDSALQALDQFVAKFPNLAEAWFGRSNVLFTAARYDEALSDAGRAIALKPGFAEAWLARGNALDELKRHDEALVAYDKALGLFPNSPTAWHGRGNALNALKRHDEALVAYNRALALAPALGEAWLGRGLALNALDRYREALSAFDRAAALTPSLVSVWLGRGRAFYELHSYDEALAAYKKALTLNPDLAETLADCGKTYIRLGQADKALNDYDRALAIKPEIKYAKGDRIHLKLQLSDWTNLETEISGVLASVRSRQIPTAPFEFLAISSSPEDQLICTKQCLADQPRHRAVWRGEKYAHERIRIGYLSADFRNHPVGRLAVGLLETHVKSRFETIALSFGPDDDSDQRHRIKSAVEDFVDVRNRNDADLAALIRRREIDILIDMMGFTLAGRFGVLARRAAPIQVNFLGYPATMGADWVDYIIADRTIIPADHFQFYAERVVWLPDTYQANDDKVRIAEPVPTRAACGLPETAFVFCCFNNTFKINPQIFDVWMRLLAATTNSVLWLLGTNPTAERNLRSEAKHRGIVPDRLIFAPRIAVADHLARHGQADLFLDTLPYNAHTTASDALRAGLPLLTCRGQTFAGRVAASVLTAVGLPELITTSLEDYEALALKLAHDPARLSEMKKKLQRNRDSYPLFDTTQFTRHVESAYESIWRAHQEGRAPAAFAVEKVAG